MVTLGTALYGPASLLMGLERAVRDTGYTLRVVNTVEGDPAGIAGAVDSLLDQGVDGIVISEPIDEEGDADVAIRADVPFLILGAPPRGSSPTSWPGPSPSICWTSGTRPSTISPVRSAGTPPGTGWRAGGPRWPRTAGANRL